MPEGRARYAHEGDTWFLFLEGELRHTLGTALNAFLDRAFSHPDYRQCLVDLSGASSIDSTCLGILARIANHARETGAPRPTLVTDNEEITETLLAVCFDRLFNLVDTGDEGEHRLQALPEESADADATLSVILDAHRRLSALDPRNAEAFRDVVTALEAHATHP